MRLRSISLILFIVSLKANAQISILNVARDLKKQNIVITDAFTRDNDSLGNVNYLTPFLNYYESYIKLNNDADNDSGSFSQMWAMLGCYKQADDLINPKQDLDSSSRVQLEAFVHYYSDRMAINRNPVAYITSKAKTAPITMINEAHDFPEHRAFVMALLPELKKEGYRYLAMETLTNDGDTNTIHLLRQKTGYYTSEPVMGELVRYALELGYKLLPYEYIPADRTPLNQSDTQEFKNALHERDSMQAVHLIARMKNNKEGKILVLGGYSHILEMIERQGEWESPFHPMALYFKELSGLDPLTIDQVHFSVTNSFSTSGKVYNELVHEGKIGNDICTLVEDSSIVGNAVQRGLSDIHNMFPKTAYVNGRPTWLTLNNLRKRYSLTFPIKTMNHLVVIQAYYLKEVTNKKDINQLVPADQFALIDNNHIDLYLRPGFDYLIVCRDVRNKIIYKQNYDAK